MQISLINKFQLCLILAHPEILLHGEVKNLALPEWRSRKLRLWQHHGALSTTTTWQPLALGMPCYVMFSEPHLGSSVRVKRVLSHSNHVQLSEPESLSELLTYKDMGQR